ncbi:MAG: PAS domain-containing protein [Thermoplasmatota archaeon]
MGCRLSNRVVSGGVRRAASWRPAVPPRSTAPQTQPIVRETKSPPSSSGPDDEAVWSASDRTASGLQIVSRGPARTVPPDELRVALCRPDDAPFPVLRASPKGRVLGANKRSIWLARILNEMQPELRRAIADALESGQGATLGLIDPAHPGEEIELTVLPSPCAGAPDSWTLGNGSPPQLAPPSLEGLPALFYFNPTVGARAPPWLGGRVKDVTGFDPSELAQNTSLWFYRVHHSDVKSYLRLLRDLAARGVARCEYRWLHADGGYRWILDCASIVLGPDGRALGVKGVRLDITELRAREEAARAGGEFWEGLVEGLPVGVCLLDERLRPLLLNRRFEEMTGVGRDGVATGRAELNFHPEDRKLVYAAAGAVLKGARRRLRCRVASSEGRYIVVELFLSRILWKGRALIQVAATRPEGLPEEEGAGSTSASPFARSAGM